MFDQSPAELFAHPMLGLGLVPLGMAPMCRQI
jgi:hypothetical protein